MNFYKKAIWHKKNVNVNFFQGLEQPLFLKADFMQNISYLKAYFMQKK